MTGRLAKIPGISRLEVQTVLELVARTYNCEAMGESANGHEGVGDTRAMRPSPAPVRGHYKNRII